MTTTILIHQCAWCRSFMINGVRINPDIVDCSEVESHGICKECESMLLGGKEAEVWNQIKLDSKEVCSC